MAEKESIYKLGVYGMRRLIRDFSNTLYGRTVFFLAYFAPMMALLAMLGLVLSSIIMQSGELFWPIAGTFFLFVGLFLLGNIYYYHELRMFHESR